MNKKLNKNKIGKVIGRKELPKDPPPPAAYPPPANICLNGVLNFNNYNA